MGIILLEGPDGAGKTTLATEDFPDYNQVHHGAYSTDTDAFQAYDKLLNVSLKSDNLVIDRMHISERIYGREYHGFCMSDLRYEHIERQCLENRIVVVLCLPHLSTVLKNWSKGGRDEMLTNSKHLEHIYNTYSRLQMYTSLPFVIYDYENNAFNERFSLMNRIHLARMNHYV